MKMKILQLPNPILRQKSLEVQEVDDNIRKTLDDMLETMYESNGVGLAAPQVGLLQRMLVIDISAKEETKQPLKMVNPRMVWHSDDIQTCSEGCLSIPNQFAPVDRFLTVRIEYLDENGEPQDLTATDFLAVAVQHEMDHLDGVVFIDHISPLRRKLILKRHEKQLRRKEKEEEGKN